MISHEPYGNPPVRTAWAAASAWVLGLVSVGVLVGCWTPGGYGGWAISECASNSGEAPNSEEGPAKSGEPSGKSGEPSGNSDFPGVKSQTNSGRRVVVRSMPFAGTQDELVVAAPMIAAQALSPNWQHRVGQLRSAVEVSRVKRHVEQLASGDLVGRPPRSEANRRARNYLVANFETMGLRPVFPRGVPGEPPALGFVSGEGEPAPPAPEVGYTQSAGGEFTNVAGLLAADDPHADVVVVVAHYDHLAPRGGQCFPGADDNAAAVAALLETARVLSDAARIDPAGRLACHVLFLCPDAEETGLRGSQYFVDHPPCGLSRIRAAVVMDLVGSDPSQRLTGRLFVAGSEGCPRLNGLVASVEGGPQLRPHRLSIGLIEAVPFAPNAVGPVSDYDAFRHAGRPFVFLSCGRSPRYHTPADTPETLNYPKLGEVTAYLLGLTVRIAQSAVGDRAAGKSQPPAFAHTGGKFSLGSDLATLTETLTALIGDGQPGAITPRVFDKLKADAVTVAELRAELDRRGHLTAGQVRRMQLIALRVQLALWRPESALSLNF